MFKFFKSKAKAGFTLIELLVVIAIIGVLASIVLASLNTARQKSRDARRIVDIKQIQLALELYYDGTGAGQYPLASTGAANCSATIQYGLEALTANNYMPQVPKDPTNPTTNCYVYATIPSPATRITYHLGATLSTKDNSALGGDRDCNDYAAAAAPLCATGAGATGGFSGFGTSAEGAGCNSTVGVAYGLAGNTETCYDVTP